MKIKQKIISLTLLIGIVTPLYATSPALAAQCGGAETSIISCSQVNQGPNAKDNAIWAILLIALNVLTAGVGIAAVAGIVWASILYASAQEEAAKVKEAKDIIRNVAIGIIAYGLMYLGLNYLIPGGIFS